MLDYLLPKKKQVAFFITARTSWDPNQQILYAKLYKQLPCIIVDGNKISKKNPSSIIFVYWNLLRSKVIVFDHSLPPGLNPSSHVGINLWHGSPIKKIRSLLQDDRFSKDFLDYQSKVSHYLVANSDYDANVISQAFCISIENVINTGLPRNEYISCTEDEILNIDIYKENILLKDRLEKFDKVILWAPTYRGNSFSYNDPIQLEQYDFLKILDVLEKRNAILLIRLHKFSKGVKNPLLSNKRVIDVTGLNNANIILRHVDVLITDYSSIWIDFLPLKKPIIIYAPDENKYSKEHGFILPFNKSIPSEIFSNFNDVTSELDSQLENPKLHFKHSVMFARYFSGVVNEETSKKIIQIIYGSFQRVIKS